MAAHLSSFPPAKRPWLRADGSSALSTSDCVSVHRKLSRLNSVRLRFHPFLRDQDAAPLMRVSRSAAAVLVGYRFVEHVFNINTTAELKSAVALYSRCRVAVSRVLLGDRWRELLVDLEAKRPLSDSVRTLATQLGLQVIRCGSRVRRGRRKRRAIRSGGYRPRGWSEQASLADTAVQLKRQAAGVLLTGLLVLDLGAKYNRELEPGGIPATVKWSRLSSIETAYQSAHVDGAANGNLFVAP